MNPTAPSLRDWTEDSTHENGNYLCFCVTCKQRFVGHKRRCECKVCATAGAAESQRRADWLYEHNAPEDWTVVTVEELRQQMSAYASLLLELNVERNLRRKVTDALWNLEGQVVQARDGFGIYRDSHTMTDALAESERVRADCVKLDAEIVAKQASLCDAGAADRSTADHTPATSAIPPS